MTAGRFGAEHVEQRSTIVAAVERVPLRTEAKAVYESLSFALVYLEAAEVLAYG